MTIAVLGAAGQLGRDLCPRLPGTVTQLTRQDADLTDTERLRQVLTALRPTVVVNCAAYNFVDRAETEPEAAFASNAFAVRRLALLCRELGCRLVHFSTDYVFGLDGQRRTPYLPGDAAEPVSVYGASKLTGEQFVRAICADSLVIRTCGLYGVWGSGGKGGNFVETMLRLARSGKPLRVVADQVCTPSYTVDVATAAAALIAQACRGLHHVTNAGQCSWHELASAIMSLSKLDVPVQPITSAEFAAPARRPSWSVLASTLDTVPGCPRPRPWREALAAYFAERAQRSANAEKSVAEK